MPSVIIVGGSVAGLATALALAGHGHRVTVLEGAAAPPEGPVHEAAGSWTRPYVPQAAHSHTLPSLGVRVLRARAPLVLADALAAGAMLIDLVEAMPGEAVREPGDEELVGLGCRRPTLELVLYRRVRATPGVEIRHGVRVVALRLDSSRQRVTGVRTQDGGAVSADLVVDATGRRSAARTWLADAGLPVAGDRTAPSALICHSRFYRLLGERLPGPLNRGNAVGAVGERHVGVLHPADDGTFSVSLGVPPGDRSQRFHHAGGFTPAAAATPGLGPWLAAGTAEPISGVRTIACPPNRLCGWATAPRPPVAGLLAVGDALCLTNPLYGRGMSLAFDHAFRLADLLAEHPEPGRLAASLAAETMLPWYGLAASDDRDRIALWRAVRSGAAAEPARPGPVRPTLRAAGLAATRDPAVWRGLTRVLMGLCLPASVLDDAAFQERVRTALVLEEAE